MMLKLSLFHCVLNNRIILQLRLNIVQQRVFICETIILNSRSLFYTPNRLSRTVIFGRSFIRSIILLFAKSFNFGTNVTVIFSPLNLVGIITINKNKLISLSQFFINMNGPVIEIKFK